MFPTRRSHRTFEGTFPFEETPDQQVAIDEVIADMCAASRDRLRSDVGFGKTEVALRATMKAVVDGKQVRSVPTTVWHYNISRRSRSVSAAINPIALFSQPVSRGDLKDSLEPF